MAKRIEPGKALEKKEQMEGSLLEINPDRKKELQELVKKRKRSFVNIIRNWIDSKDEDKKV